MSKERLAFEQTTKQTLKENLKKWAIRIGLVAVGILGLSRLL